MRNRMGFSTAVAIVIVIFVLVAAGAGYWYYTQQNTNTADHANTDNTTQNINGKLTFLNRKTSLGVDDGVATNIPGNNINLSEEVGNNSGRNINVSGRNKNTSEEKTNSTAINSNTSINTNSVSNTNSTSGGTTTNTTPTGTNSNINTYVPSWRGIDLLTWFEDDDQDSVLNISEAVYGTLKNNVDSDGDGYNDNTEIQACYNPTGSGRINGTYYLNVYCPNLISMVLDMYEYSASDAIPIKNEYVSLCKNWTAFVDEVYGNGMHDGRPTTEYSSYTKACDATKAQVVSGELDSILSLSEIDRSNPEDECTDASDIILAMCELWEYVE